MPLSSEAHAGTIALAVGLPTAFLAGYCLSTYLARRGVAGRSTTSSAGGGALAYETSKAVDEYLQLHFAQPDEVLPYDDAPKGAVNFPERCAILVERHCDALKDFTGERPAPLALDVGCAVGGAAFELSKCGFGHVMGIDYSRAFITAADTMRERGSMHYSAVVEGDITERRLAQLPQGTDATRVRFRTGDACSLPAELAPVDALLAANLLCRLPNPRAFLDRLPSLVNVGGCVVLTTPWSWLEAWTRRGKWLGGYTQGGKEVRSFETLKSIMTENGFELRAEEEMPFVIREHARKFQWGCAHGSVWVRQGRAVTQ